MTVSTATTYVSGSLVRTTATFTDDTGTPTDPTTTTLRYKTGAGAVTTVVYPTSPVLKDATGVYHADLDSTGWDGPGNQLWQVQWSGSGAVVAISEPDSWEIEPPLQ